MKENGLKILEEIRKSGFDNLPANSKITRNKDAAVGDIIIFQRPTFTGSFRRPKFAGYETILAEVQKESYGFETQQHTFTLKNIETDTTFRIKGRNLYGTNFIRILGNDDYELKRKEIADEKHRRGAFAREGRTYRKEMNEVLSKV
ncbi:MAG: hypothetical protein LBQ37_02365 [Elusimicrobiota bacterium]|jgi:hypothetical protein|nr:hypothetical protein [Elusimicrobiota bacterium]